MPDSGVEVIESTGSYFRVVIPPNDEFGRRPRYIAFQPVPHAVIPPDVAALHIEIERALTTLNMLFAEGTGKLGAGDLRYAIYFDKLAGIAIAGLGQDQSLLGSMALTTLKEEVLVREGGRVKNAYIRRLGVWAFAFVAVLLLLYWSVRGCWLPWPAWLAGQREFLVLLLGSSIGTWLSFSIRKVELKFSELAVIENDNLDPAIRLFVVAGLTLTIGLIFSTGFAAISIGKFNTEFLAMSSHALLIGLFCGIGEQRLSNTVGAKAGQFFDAFARNPGPPPPPPPGGGQNGENGGQRPPPDDAEEDGGEKDNGDGRAERGAPSKPDKSEQQPETGETPAGDTPTPEDANQPTPATRPAVAPGQEGG